MKLGIALNIAGDPEHSDVDVLTNHLHLGDLVEPLGFDSLFVFEHHFSDYILSPCPISLLSYFAGRTKRIMLGTSVIILPWHNPLLVAERMLLLDALSGQRTIYGFGTGRAPSEFAALSTSFEEALQRWHEGLEIVRQAMAGRSVKFCGQFYSVDDVEPRPRPASSRVAQFYSPASTSTSALRAAAAGLGMILSAELGSEQLMSLCALHQETARHSPLPAPILFAPIFIGDSDAEANAHAAEYRDADRSMAASHYFGGAVRPKHERSETTAPDHLVGAPSTCIAALRALQRATGCDHIVLEISFGAMPHELAEANLRRVAAEILPEVASW